jgi:hypothetical protein
VSGDKVFVLDIYDHSVGEYTTSGKTVNAKLIKDLETPETMALTPDGKKIFVVCRAKGPGYVTRDNEGKMVIGHKLAMFTVYSTSGEVLEPWLVVVPGWEIPDSIAIAEDFVYVANSKAGTIGKYTTAGKVVKDPLIAGLSSPSALAVSGDNIFVTDSENDTIGQYTVSGETVNPALVSGLEYPSAIAIAGDNIFVVTGRPRTIGVYTRSGATVNASLISGIDGGSGAIAIIP